MRQARRAVAAVAVATLTALSSTAAGAGPIEGAGSTAMTLVPMSHQLGLVSASSLPPSVADCQAIVQLSCYGPRELQAAYDLRAVYARKVTGRGQTIVIVDAYGSPTLGRDLKSFDRAYHLPATSLKVISPAGAVPAYKPTGTRLRWAAETTLDVEYAHAMAPGARILVVALPSDRSSSAATDPVVVAEQYVVNHRLGSVISQSFGSSETSFTRQASLLARRGPYVAAAAHNITVLASTGDVGASQTLSSGRYSLSRAVSWPASDPLVTAVGGTAVHLDANGVRTAPDTAWNDTASAAVQSYFGVPGRVSPIATGGGKSQVFGRPSYQKKVATVVRGSRGVPDIALSAACDGAALTYQSFPGVHPGWYPACGTSEAAPLFAGIVALADQAGHRQLGLLNPRLYALYAAHAPGLPDVTSGTTTVTFDQGGVRRTVLGTSVHAGYDLGTGVGTIDAGALVFELAAHA